MDPDNTKKLDELLKITKENNELLRKTRRAQKNAQLLRGLYWLVIVALSLGAYYYVEPYLKTITSLYTDTTNSINSLENFTDNLPDVQGVKNFFNGGDR